MGTDSILTLKGCQGSEITEDISYDPVDVGVPAAPVRAHPGVELAPTDKQFATDLIAGKRPPGIFEQIAELPHAETRVR